MRICSKCTIEKEDSEFSLGQIWCKVCDNDYHKSHYQSNKQYYIDKSKNQRLKLKNYVNEYKMSHPCIKCGESDIACLDFHHLHDKDDCVGSLVNKGRSIEILKKEIDKCVVLCANCHRKLHFS